jgi:hypothetical protein
MHDIKYFLINIIKKFKEKKNIFKETDY